MTNDTIKHIDNELTQLKSDLAVIKDNLEKRQAEKASRLEDSLFSPKLFEHYHKVAETLSKSNMVPKQYIGQPADIFVAMAMGYQLGFSVEQSMQDIAVINGRPCLWGDGLLALCLNHPDCEGIDEEPLYNGKNKIGYTCTVKRKGHEAHTHTFTLQDAEKAGLLKRGAVWGAYPIRMCQMRARSLALRDKFADALRGLRIAEIEDEDKKVIQGELAEKKPSQTSRLLEKISDENQSNQEKKADNGEGSAGKEAPESNASQEKDEDAELDLLAKTETIKELMQEKEFDAQRTEKAFNYFGVTSVNELSSEQADLFIMQLERA